VKAKNTKVGMHKAEQSARTIERRKHGVSVAYSIEADHAHTKKFTHYLFGTLVDISDRGICFKAKDSFSPDKIISLYLKLSDKTDGIKMIGKIIWVKPDQDGYMRVGVKFIGLLPTDWIKLLPKEKITKPRASEKH
jgi:hypothetical protein